MWAAGCVLYTMLSGIQPFYSEYIVDLIEKIENCKIEFPEQEWKYVSEEAKNLIKSLLIKEPG